MEAVLRSEFREGQRRGEQLHVGSRHEIFVRILLVKSLTALGVRNEQSPLSFLFGVGANKATARTSEFAVAFFEAPPFFFAPEPPRCFFAFACRPRRGAAIPPTHT